MPIAGDVALLIALWLGFLVAALGLGLLVSSAAQTQVQAMLGVFALTLPSILRSGVFLRAVIYAAGDAVGWVSDTAESFFEIPRGVILRCAGLEDLRVPVTRMLALGTVVLVAACVRFKHRSLS